MSFPVDDSRRQIPVLRKFAAIVSTVYLTVKVQGVPGADFTRILRLSLAVETADIKIPPDESEAVAVPWFTQVNVACEGGAVKEKIDGPQRANVAPVSRRSTEASVGRYRLPAL
jgi:hypothetical protein